MGWLLRYPTARTAVQEKVRRDLTPFPFVEEIIEGTLIELFERVDNRAIWRHKVISRQEPTQKPGRAT